MSGTNTAYPIGLDHLNAVSQIAAQEFVFRRLLAGVATAKLVKVVSSTSSGAAAIAGTVTVLPLVNQIDGFNNATPHGNIYSIPYFRAQGGASAIILDPAAGDIGVAVFCDRDSSSVVRTKAQSNPGSRRVMDMADGLYLGGFLNAIPTQYLQFLGSGGGINIVSPGAITLNAQGKTWTFGTAGLTLSNGVITETHIHDQPNDTAGDGESPTYGPINP